MTTMPRILRPLGAPGRGVSASLPALVISWPVSRVAAEGALGAAAGEATAFAVEVLVEADGGGASAALTARTGNGELVASRGLWRVGGLGVVMTRDPAAGLVHLDAPGRLRLTLVSDAEDNPPRLLHAWGADAEGALLGGGARGVPTLQVI